MDSRLDTLQAEVLRIGLRHLPSVIERWRRNVAQDRAGLAGHCFRPAVPCIEVAHTFGIPLWRRLIVVTQLAEIPRRQGIETTIHYPLPNSSAAGGGAPATAAAPFR